MSTQHSCTNISVRRGKRSGGNHADPDQELERRRHQNKIAQRKYRDNVQQRLQEYDQLKAVLSTVDPSSLSSGLINPDHVLHSTLQRSDQENTPSTLRLYHQTTTAQPIIPASAPLPSGRQIATVTESASAVAMRDTVTTVQLSEHTMPAHSSPELVVSGVPIIADSPLHLAAASSHVEVVQLLLQKGALIDMPNAQQETALHIAASRGHIGVVDCLLEAGARTNLKDSTGMMALHRAVANGHTELARRLVMVGADVNAKGGCT